MQWEGKENTTYRDIVDIPTVCYGQTGTHIRMGQTFTDAECAAMLDAELRKYLTALDRCITQPVTPNQGAAVLSWTYNVGTGAACGSTLVRKLNAGAPTSEWCGELLRWNRAGGKVVRGLTLRRQAEHTLCVGG